MLCYFSDSTSPDADENDTPAIPRVQSPKQASTSSEKEPNTAEGLPVSDNELPNLEEVTPKMAEASLDEAKEIPLPAITSDEEEFHEASESVSALTKKAVGLGSFETNFDR